MPVLGKKIPNEMQIVVDPDGKRLMSMEEFTRNLKTEDLAEKTPTKDIVSGRFGSKVVESLGNKFLVYNHAIGTVTCEPILVFDGIRYVPRQQEPYRPYTEPHFLGKAPDIKTLSGEVFQVIDDFIDTTLEYKRLLTMAVLFTYKQQKSFTTPYLYLTGEKESGKTRVLEILNCLAYRPMMASSITAPNIFQYLEDGPVGIILDDEIEDSIRNDPDKRNIYKSGYRASGKVPRIMMTSSGKRQQIFFNTYAFKVFASKNLSQDDQLSSRCIPFPMTKGDPKYCGFKEIDDYPRFQKIRNNLLLWKITTETENYSQERPRCRADELFLPLLDLARFVGDLSYTVAIGLIRNCEVIKRDEEERATLEAKILLSLVELHNHSNAWTFSFDSIWSMLKETLNGKIADNRITSDDFEVSKKSIAYKLRDVFGANRNAKLQNGKFTTYYTFDLRNIEKLKIRYRLKGGEMR